MNRFYVLFQVGFLCKARTHGIRSRKGTLRRLVDSVHEEKKPFGCTICGASFTQNVKVEGHLESVHESIGHIRTLSFLKGNCDLFPS